MRPFRFGLQTARITDPAAWSVLARRAEAEGYASLPRDPSLGPPPILVGGGSPRVLATAGRLADIISVSTRATPDGRVDARNIRLSAVEHKVAMIREAAGARFGDIMEAIAPVVGRLARGS